MYSRTLRAPRYFSCRALLPLTAKEPPSGRSSQRRQNASVPKVLLMWYRSFFACWSTGARAGMPGRVGRGSLMGSVACVAVRARGAPRRGVPNGLSTGPAARETGRWQYLQATHVASIPFYFSSFPSLLGLPLALSRRLTEGMRRGTWGAVKFFM